MNVLSIHLHPCGPESAVTVGGVAFTGVCLVTVWIDWNAMADISPAFDGTVVVFDELDASRSASGRYLIFTCPCGIAECGGGQGVEVTVDAATIRWSLPAGDTVLEYVFARDQYEAEVDRARAALSAGGLPVAPADVIFPLEFRRQD